MNKYTLDPHVIAKLVRDWEEANRIYRLLCQGMTATAYCHTRKWVYGTPMIAEYKFKPNPDNTFSIYRLS